MRPSIRLLLLLLAAAACAGPQKASSAAVPDTLDRIKAAKTIKLGYRESSVPFSFVGPDGAPAGYSVDLCTRVVHGLRADLAMADLRIEWVKVTPDTRIAALVDGTIDLECGSTTSTFSRQEQVDFSNLTFVDGSTLLSIKTTKVSAPGDSTGMRIAVIPGTTTEKLVRNAFQNVATTQIIPVKEHAEGLAAVDQGSADVYASDRSILLGLALASPDPKHYSILARFLSYEPYGLMLRHDVAFRLAVNRQLGRIYRTNVAELYNKWFGPLGPPNDLLLALYALSALPE
ncbi:MAG TPA: amino acid ABC transporter substrate-binding protein [Myxococcales bacterium]|nr:amino acid ABC transporter substrate-binding protein [Myxococcales bacterium]